MSRGLGDVYKRQGLEREGDKSGSVASYSPPTGNLAHNPGMYPGWESNWQRFGLQAGTQSTKPRQPGLNRHFFLALKHTINIFMSLNLKSWMNHNFMILPS